MSEHFPHFGFVTLQAQHEFQCGYMLWGIHVCKVTDVKVLLNEKSL